MVTAGAAGPVFALGLADHAWRSRPLLVFAPSEDDMRLQRTLGQLRLRRCELDDRDMVIGVLLSGGQSRLGAERLSHQEAARIRSHRGIRDDQFAAVLIGKDGGEKYRTHEIPDLAQIFSFIDGMPMRRAEISRDPVDCSGARR